MYYYIHISERIYSDLCRVKRIFYRNPKPLNGHAPFFFTILDPLDKNERICSDFYALFKPILAIIVGGLNRSDWVGMLRFQQSDDGVTLGEGFGKQGEGLACVVRTAPADEGGGRQRGGVTL